MSFSSSRWLVLTAIFLAERLREGVGLVPDPRMAGLAALGRKYGVPFRPFGLGPSAA